MDDTTKNVRQLQREAYEVVIYHYYFLMQGKEILEDFCESMADELSYEVLIEKKENFLTEGDLPFYLSANRAKHGHNSKKSVIRSHKLLPFLLVTI